MVDIQQVVSRFGASAKATLANPSVTGEPEDQLRPPLVTLFGDLAELCGFKREWLTGRLRKPDDAIHAGGIGQSRDVPIPT